MNEIHHSFGGDWTEKKLTVLKKYLGAYTKALKNTGFQLYYIDAFAGTRYRMSVDESENESEQLMLFPEFSEIEKKFFEGSARIALQLEPSFHEYIFIEKNQDHYEDLLKLKNDFPEKTDKIEVIQGEANETLLKLLKVIDWRKCRAVLFLDPYGLQVRWETIEAIARTRGIDLWYLFPLASAVNRLLRRDGQINDSLRSRLTNVFGTEEWFKEFYSPIDCYTLFGNIESMQKNTDFTAIKKFLIKRLKGIFAGVAENPLELKNSKNVPIFLFCFAAGNPNGKKLALKIAEYILNSEK